MHRILFIAILLFTACSKEKGVEALPDNSIAFELQEGKDTVMMPLSILGDTIITLNFKAVLSGFSSAEDHWVSFAVDTSKISSYRLKYGAATLLPASSYLFYRSQTRLPAGAAVTEPTELNIVQQTRLTEYTTYVLPVVIQSVDGKPEGPAKTEVLYYVLRTGRPMVISKTGWTIAGVSSIFNSFVAANVIDDNKTGTYWTSNITQSMPQWISINFNRDVTFSALSYSVPTLLNYPTQGGYPTSIRIETSMDGNTWVDKGIFAGDISNNTQTIDMGITTARYLRYTSLASVKFANVYAAIFISDITLLP